MLDDAQMDLELYKFELEKLLPELTKAVNEDKGVYVYAITEDTHKIRGCAAAMVLVEKSSQVFVNEAAKETLKALWADSYVGNIRKMRPIYVKTLSKDDIPINGIR